MYSVKKNILYYEILYRCLEVKKFTELFIRALIASSSGYINN